MVNGTVEDALAPAFKMRFWNIGGEGQVLIGGLETLPDARLLEALMQQHGVGIKVANCVALFAYGRMECAPVDVWIQRVIDQHYAGQNPFPAYGNAGILQQWMFYFARSEKERVK